jgi:DNA-directed RNA polymerase specialized sigma24 family protein
VDAQEETVRLLAIHLRRSVESQSQAIEELNRAGFGPARIAELLGTTANTVNVQLAKAKAKKRTRPKEG